jgi:hypothetical protein
MTGLDGWLSDWQDHMKVHPAAAGKLLDSLHKITHAAVRIKMGASPDAGLLELP